MPRLNAPLLTVALAYGFLGVDIYIQEAAWEKGAAYAILINLIPIQFWGVLYLAVFVLGLAHLRWPRFALDVLVHTIGFALTATWLIGFITTFIALGGALTMVLVVNWAVYLSLLIRSARWPDELSEPPPDDLLNRPEEVS